jgi:hypothetical protein
MELPTKTAAVILAAVALIAGCTSSTEQASTPEPGVAMSSAPETAVADRDETPDVYAFGETHEDTITTKVDTPQPFTTSDTAAPEQNAPAFTVEITFTNTADQPFPTSALQISATVDGHTVEQVFDNDVSGSLPTLTPGQTVTTTLGWLGQGDTYQVTVASLDGSQAYTWEGSAA